MQKAFLAGIPLVAAVSAPSSLAIELAQDSGVTLIGFLRGQDFNVYTHPERIDVKPVARAAARALRGQQGYVKP